MSSSRSDVDATRKMQEALDLVFGALANRHRREIVHLVALQPYSISRLAERRGLSLQAIHKHIRVLERAGLIQRRKIGRANFVALKRTSLRGLQDWVGQYHVYWGTDDETLENYESFLTTNPSKEE